MLFCLAYADYTAFTFARRRLACSVLHCDRYCRVQLFSAVFYVYVPLLTQKPKIDFTENFAKIDVISTVLTLLTLWSP